MKIFFSEISSNLWLLIDHEMETQLGLEQMHSGSYALSTAMSLLRPRNSEHYWDAKLCFANNVNKSE